MEELNTSSVQAVLVRLGIETANYYAVPAIKCKYIPRFPLHPDQEDFNEGWSEEVPYNTCAPALSMLPFVLPWHSRAFCFPG